MPVTKYQFCCGCLPIFSGIFAIAFHGLVHGIYGVCLILTTFYSPGHEVLNYLLMSGFLLLAVIGFPMLWAVIFQNVPGIKFVGSVFVILSVFNFAGAIAYFVVYFPFRANSLLDKVFLWRYGSTWVTREQLPFTIWHLLTGLLVAITPLWFYYCYVVFEFVEYLKVIESEDFHVPQVIVLENRLGPFGYRPPEGYPYTTNRPPQMEGQYIQIYAPERNRGQQDNNPKAILD